MGTRLWPYTSILPKALLPIGGKPVIIWILERLRQHGFEDVVLCVNEEFKDQFEYQLSLMADRLQLDVKMSTSPRPLGTAGEIYNARRYIDGPFLLHYGDELTKMNLSGLWSFHISKLDAIGTLALVRGVPIEVGVIKLRGNLVADFHEKPPLDRYTWAGIAVLEPEILDFVTEPEGLDFALDIFPSVLRAGKKLYAYKSGALWLDVGTIGHYRRALELAKKGLL